MKTVLLLSGVMLMLWTPLVAQTGNTAPNSFYIELLGNGLLYSFNYDRMITDEFGARAGIGYVKVKAAYRTEKASLTTVPVMIHYLIGSGGSKLELGAGVVFVTVSADIKKVGSFEGSATAGTATFGYRYQPARAGLNARVGFTPLFGKFGFQPWLGVSIGYGF